MNQAERRNEIEEFIKDHIASYLSGVTLDEDELGELHQELFNRDYYIIGYYKASQWLGEDAFEVIGQIKDYETDNFGEVHTDFSSSETVANMHAYMIAEEVIQEMIEALEE